MKQAIVTAAIVLACAVALRAQSVPNPGVIGPIPVTAAPGDPSHGYPFFSTNVDLASRGYIEEEFFLDGVANTYNVDPAVPKGDTAEITSSNHPYRTHMVVRRPLAAEDFNGTVIMEWQNVTAGYEPDALWIASHDHLLQRGYAWVGVSAQRAGVLFLKAWSPSRYGSLNIGSDAYSWDIFSQAGQAVRHPQGVDPMGGLDAARVFAAGWSQSAVRLNSYLNSIHLLAGVFDAFALVGLDGKVLNPLRTDLDVKVFKLVTETSVAGNALTKSQAWIRGLEDTDDFRIRFRRWEIAGASQLGYHEVQEAAPIQVRDLGSSSLPTCDLPSLSRIPSHYVANAAYDHLVEWVKHGVPPPLGADIEVASLGEQTSVLARDGLGNVLGGVRLSQHAVPTATNTGLNTPVASCRHLGSYQLFDQATLNALYPDHQMYLELVIETTHETQKLGFITGADAAATIRDAARSDIGRW